MQKAWKEYIIKYNRLEHVPCEYQMYIACVYLYKSTQLHTINILYNINIKKHRLYEIYLF